MDPFQKDGERDRQKTLKALEQYPYTFQISFQMRDIRLAQKAYEGLRNHLEAGIRAGYSTSLQTASTRNLLTFILFQLGEHQKALEETEEVLKMDDQRDNIVSLANKAYILSKMDCFDEADEAIDDLKNLQETPGVDYGYLLVKAKAELASTYLRFGPRFNKKAIDAFLEVIQQARKPEVWAWKFCLAVAYRHALDLQHAPYVDRGKYKITHIDGLDLLQEIIDSMAVEGQEDAHRNLQANAHAEMGLLLRLTWDKTTEYQLCSRMQTGAMACCKKALELDDNDASVLWKAGKLHRNYKDLFKSRKLLEKAVSLQESSAAYHHLGLTYKAMATSLHYGKLKTRRGGKIQKERKEARELKMTSQQDESRDAVHRQGPSVPVPGRQRVERERVERLKKTVKSPLHSTQFDPNEQNVQLAVQNLKKAMEFSADENSRAMYDLALLYKAMKKFDDALKLLTQITRRQNGQIATPSGHLEQFTSLEQMGLIYKQMADEETDLKKQETLRKKSDSKMNEAVLRAAQLYSDVAHVKDIFGEIFHSPAALLKAADESSQSDGDKRKTKAKIFSLMKNYTQSQNLLTHTAEREKDAEYHKLRIDNMYRSGQHDGAAAALASLKPTQLYPKVIKLFESQRGVHNPVSLFDIHFSAGKYSLSDGSCGDDHFTEAFRLEVKPPDLPPASSASATPGDESTSTQSATATSGEESTSTQSATATPGDESTSTHSATATPGDESTSSHRATAMNTESSKSGCEGPCDVYLLHDDEDEDIKGKAARLGDTLNAACGLRVTRRDTIKPGKDEAKEIENNIENCRLLVVLPGKESRLPEFDRFVRYAAMRESVVLLTEGIGPETIPEELKTCRSTTCPVQLFAPGIDADGPYTQDFIDAVCHLFQFLANRD